jgi:hypothetical protein
MSSHTLFETIETKIGSDEQNEKNLNENEKLSIKKTNVTMMDWKREICVLFGKNCIISRHRYPNYYRYSLYFSSL